MDTLVSETQAVNAPKQRRTVRQAYQGIDVSGDSSTWPAGPLPRLTPEEAIPAAKLLWRKAVGRVWPGTWELTSGNRYTRSRRGVFHVNPDKGWMQLVHSISHIAYRRLISTGGTKVRFGGKIVTMVSTKLWEDYRTAASRPHSDSHAHLEKALVAYVMAEGFLDGRLKKFTLADEPVPKVSLTERNEARVDASIVQWTAKLNVAKKKVVTAEKRLKELGAKKRYYDRKRAR